MQKAQPPGPTFPFITFCIKELIIILLSIITGEAHSSGKYRTVQKSKPHARREQGVT